MRNLVIALIFLCLVLTGTTIYFARELAHERALTTAQATHAAHSEPASQWPRAAAPAPAGKPPRHERTPPDVNAKPVKAEAASSAATTANEEAEAAQLRFATAFLAQAADLKGREDLVAERRMHMRHSFPALERVVGLSATEHAQLLTLLSEQQIEAETAHSRCVVDPACNSRQWHASTQTRQQDIAALLGPDRAQKFDQYKNTLGERETVTQMRARLPDSQRLSEVNAEGLVAALAEERTALTSQPNSDYFGFGVGSGMLFAPSQGTPDSQYEAARQYSQRLRDRAGPYLNSEQLRLFNEMQDEQLLAFRNMLRNKHGQYSAVTNSN